MESWCRSSTDLVVRKIVVLCVPIQFAVDGSDFPARIHQQSAGSTTQPNWHHGAMIFFLFL
eukprot:NODE_9069_length_490_cov_2.759637_g7995_i0.p2 GENE.NODE_9069_length_490_cov_2.759637_g7995_i0~~NODE_9069_length_490_cov_2.759637_g7995_i0.p2  ORF type:complete len:61 (+),score=5.82 NODE_9069_length_490_cov_2.759637_g7995_i0:46-228(+)